MGIKASVKQSVKSIRFRLANVGWDDFRSLGNSRLISTAFLWVVLVPWVARVLDWLNAVWPSEEKFTLPRNLWAAWIMSWLFVFAQGLYWLRCPAFLKKFWELRSVRAPARPSLRTSPPDAEADS